MSTITLHVNQQLYIYTYYSMDVYCIRLRVTQDTTPTLIRSRIAGEVDERRVAAKARLWWPAGPRTTRAVCTRVVCTMTDRNTWWAAATSFVRFVIPDLLSHKGLEPFNFDRVRRVGGDDGFMMDGPRLGWRSEGRRIWG